MRGHNFRKTLLSTFVWSLLIAVMPLHFAPSILRHERLISLENELMEISKYVINEGPRMLGIDADVTKYEHILRLVAQSEPINNQTMDNSSQIAKNLFSLYHVMKRIHCDWLPKIDELLEHVFVKKMSAVNERLERIKIVIKNEAELVSSAQQLLRLQRIYEVPITFLTAGILRGARHAPLGVSDIARLVQTAVDVNNARLALEWVNSSRDSLTDVKSNPESYAQYLGAVANAHIQLRNWYEANETYGELLKLDPESRSVKSSLELIKRKLVDEENERRNKEETRGKEADGSPREKKTKKTRGQKEIDEEAREKEDLDLIGNYSYQLCRNPWKMNKYEEAKLKCQIKTIPASNVKVRIEELHLGPKVILIHDLLGPGEVEKLKEETSKVLYARLGETDEPNRDDLNGVLFDTRLRWMEHYARLLRNITYDNRVFDDAHNLAYLHVVNVGVGAKRDPYVVENLRTWTPVGSWKIANYLIFLNEVEEGGSIVFPDLKLKIDPVEGSALFWQTRWPTGEVRKEFQRYIECPVLVGSRWLARAFVGHMNNQLRWINL